MDALLTDYRANQAEIWDARADEIHQRWSREQGDFALLSTHLPHPLLSVLDLGVGYGRLWPVYRHAGRCVGVDLSVRMLDIARQGLPSGHSLELVHSRLCRLPLDDDSIETAISVRTLAHLHPLDVGLALAEIRRVCYGRFLLIESLTLDVDPRLEFRHDYPFLLSNAGFGIRQRLDIESGAVFIEARPLR